MSFDAPRHDRIHKLRLHVPAGHLLLQPPPELRALELHPNGLPQSAIAVLRRLRVARRGTLGGPRSLPGSAWREAAQDAVTAALRTAVRPIGDSVQGPCDAVLFADLAELLACLARDWLDGTIAARWWWRELFTQTPTLDAICAAWLGNAPALEAARDLLRAEGRWDAFIAQWPARDSERLRRLVEMSAFVQGNGSAADARFEHPGRWAASVPRRAVADVAPAGSDGAVGASTSATPPRLRAVGEAHPAVVLTSGDGVTVPRRELTAARATVEAKNDDGRVGDPAAPRAHEGLAGQPEPRAAPDVPTPGVLQALITSETRTDMSAASAPALDALSPRQLLDSSSPARADVESDAGELERAAAVHIAASVPARSVPRVTSSIEASRLHTEYGGLFYLLNVALHLDLYADFTQPRRAGLPLSPWDLLAWIGQRWFGAPLQRDPLWAALASWAGRDPHDEIAASFVAPSSWQVADDWLRPFDRPDALTMRRVGGRVRLRHPAGFCVCDLDIASSASLPAWLATMPALVGLAIVESPPRLPRFDAEHERHRWLAHLARYVRARCALALHASRHEVPVLLARHPAHVVATPATLEVRLSLATLPLSIRIAGLDRDPGWLPAAGRSVRFVFG